jgi:hypothetical protein
MSTAPFAGAADTGEGRWAGGEALHPNWTAAYVAYFVCAEGNFPQCRVNFRQAGACLIASRRDVLPLERDGGAFGVVLVVAPGCAVARAGHDRAEVPFKFGDEV